MTNGLSAVRNTTMTTIVRACALWLLALAGAAQAASTITYYHNDLAGSPVAATNASGQVIWRESYRPYGERLTNQATSSGNKIWFTSRQQDVETGLVYMGARYYDPVVGRFMSTDPVQFMESNLHSFNRYAYANNNPYKYVDPDGNVPVLIPLVGMAVRALAQRAMTFALTRGASTAVTAGEIGAGEALGGGTVAGVIAADRIAAAGARGAAQVTESGLALVERHLAQFGSDPANAVMIQRLRGGERSTQDLNFYLHELKESSLMKHGADGATAHRGALDWQGIPYQPGYEAKLYSKDAIKAGGDSFSPAARRAAGVE